jgi:hypothetical protein
MSLNTVSLKASFVSFSKLSADRGVVIRSILSMLGEPCSYETYEEARKAFAEVRTAANPKASNNSIDLAWGQFKNAAVEYAENEGFEFAWPAKPKATSADAVKKQAQRAVPESVASAQTVTQLEAIAKPADAIEAAKLDAAIATKKLALIKAEAKSDEKKLEDALKDRRAALIAKIKLMDIAQLFEIEAMVNHDAGTIIAALPLAEVNQAVAKLAKLAKEAKKTAPV